MNSFSKLFLCLTVMALAIVGASSVQAQGITTGNLAGNVAAADDGSGLPGVIVEAVHVPTGTRYNTVTNENGRFVIQNVRVGGPYNVTFNMDGFAPVDQTGIMVQLGETTTVDADLQLATVSEEMTVVADFDTLINPSRTGSSTNVSEQVIETLPTLSRGLEDFARVSPYFNVIADGGDGQATLTVAGRNNRYNNIQIDGAVNNDLFGLAATGTPGGQAETQPVSLDAIEQIQLLVSPYDVRQGGFSGGGLNAVTRSGTNQFAGSAYYFTRDDSFVGDGPDDREFGEFSEDEYGFRLGGPLMQDKLFFFVNAERTERSAPSGFSADGSSGQAFVNPAAAAEFRNILINTYGYDPGGLGEFTQERNSDKIFGRLDWNISPQHIFTFRHNYVDADNDRYFPSTRSYDFPDVNYDFLSETNSSVVQLNSFFGDVFNEARITYQTIEDNRGGARAFPAITVELPDGSSLNAGTEPFSTRNSLDQDLLEITDDLTWVWGDHEFVIGTHNELFSFDNLFIRQAFGDYTFLGLDNLEAGKAQTYDYSFSATGNPVESARFDVNQLGLYAGDQWRVNEQLSLTGGIRVDVPFFPDDPSRNPDAEAIFGFRTDETPDGNAAYSPRIGFNYDLLGDGEQQLRGGIGLFAGRTPYVWISNQYSNTGNEFTRVSAFIPESAFDPNTNFIPFNPDPFGQPENIGGAATNEINLIDPNFDFPQVLRYTLGWDARFDLLGGLETTAEVIYGETQEDVLFQNLNIVPTGRTLSFDGRPTFTRGDSSFRDVILLTNTSEGDQLNAVVRVTRPFREDGFYATASYAYGESNVVTDGTSSQARSNWRFLEVQGDPNDPGVATSDFEIKHRFNGALSYTFDLGPVSNTVSLFYEAQAGRPYSTTFSNDINGDFESNDLLYVPASQDEVIITGGTWEDFNSYIEADEGLRDARGSIVERNASRQPWVHQLDFRYAVGLPISVVNTELTLDIINVANLIDEESGVVRYVPFGEVSPVRYGGIDQATGKPIYQLNFTDPDGRFDLDDLRSRWQARVGLRLSF